MSVRTATRMARLSARAEELGVHLAQLGGTPVGILRSGWLAEISVRLEHGDDRAGITGAERRVVAADHVGRMPLTRFQNGGPELVAAQQRPLAVVDAEFGRAAMVGEFSD